MKASRRAALTLAILACSSLSFAEPAKSLCDDPSKTHTLEASTSGEIIEGPACVQVTVNALRYSAALVKTITFTAGPALTSVFPKAGEAAGFDKSKVVLPATPTLEQKFSQIWDRVNRTPDGISSAFYQGRQATNRRISADIDKYLANLKNSVVQSDEILATSKPPAVLQLVKNDAFQAALLQAISEAKDSWRTSDDILVGIHAAQQDLAALPQIFAQPITGVPAGPDPCATAAWQQWFTQCG